MRAVATKSLVIWPRACWPEGCFFGHWRSGTTFSLATGGATRRAVRKHRAPKGALRQWQTYDLRDADENVRKHRAPKGALRPGVYLLLASEYPQVRKHRAPKGALRRALIPQGRCPLRVVRKHRAPKGALRHCLLVHRSLNGHRVRKHRAPKGALRRLNHRPHQANNDRRVRKHRAPDNFACNSLSSNFNERRKPRHFNDAASTLEGVEAELHAIFSNNPPR